MVNGQTERCKKRTSNRSLKSKKRPAWTVNGQHKQTERRAAMPWQVDHDENSLKRLIDRQTDKNSHFFQDLTNTLLKVDVDENTLTCIIYIYDINISILETDKQKNKQTATL